MTESSTLARVEGVNLVLRLIRPDDANYVHSLRTNPAYNRHLSEVRGTVEDQRRWIENYKARESEAREFYYVIERKEGQRCGLVRLYNIGQETFTWGSWTLGRNRPRNAALESAMLSFGLGFEILGCEKAVVEVRVRNERAIAFYRRLGMTETHRTEREIYFVYPRSRYDADKGAFLKILEHPVSL
jgi:RimJ/RimL family protein N-acetyltransferase